MPTPGSEHERESTVHARIHVPQSFHAPTWLPYIMFWTGIGMQFRIWLGKLVCLFFISSESDSKIGLTLETELLFYFKLFFDLV